MASIETFALPSKLYRYRSLGEGLNSDEIFDREIEAIVQSYIYCSTFDAMNDPMEGLHRETQNLRAHSARDDIINEIKTIVQTVGISSFSESIENEPMWAHYADQFKGICVAYSFSRLRKALSRGHQFVRMLYTEQAPIFGTSKIDAAYRARLTLSAKKLNWASEREWRLIQKESGRAEYRDPSCVLGVYLGARVSVQKREAIIRRLIPLEIPVYAMNVQSYETSFVKISPKVKVRRKP